MSQRTFKVLFWAAFATGGVIGWYGARKSLKKLVGV